MKAELAQLIALQNADSNIRTLQAEIESIPQRRAEIEKEFDQRAFEIRALEEKRDTAFHERARVEQEIFEQAIALPSGEAREGFLLGACGQNRELRRSIDELLAAFDDAGKL